MRTPTKVLLFALVLSTSTAIFAAKKNTLTVLNRSKQSISIDAIETKTEKEQYKTHKLKIGAQQSKTIKGKCLKSIKIYDAKKKLIDGGDISIDKCEFKTFTVSGDTHLSVTEEPAAIEKEATRALIPPDEEEFRYSQETEIEGDKLIFY